MLSGSTFYVEEEAKPARPGKVAKEIAALVNKRRKKKKRRAEEGDAEDGPEAVPEVVIAAQEAADAMDLEGVYVGQKVTLNEDLFESRAGEYGAIVRTLIAKAGALGHVESIPAICEGVQYILVRTNAVSLKCLQSQISDAASVAIPVAPSGAAEGAAAAVAEEAAAAVAEEAAAAAEEAAAAAEEAAAAASTGIPIGAHVSVHWSKERKKNKWFEGIVRSYDEEDGEHLIQYADGDEDWECLEREGTGKANGGKVKQWKFIITSVETRTEGAMEGETGRTETEGATKAARGETVDGPVVDGEAVADAHWFCVHCDFHHASANTVVQHEQSCAANPSRLDPARSDPARYRCSWKTHGSEQLATKYFQCFNKFRMLRELYRPTRGMCKHEVAQHEARAISYGNWFPVRWHPSYFQSETLLSVSGAAVSLRRCCQSQTVRDAAADSLRCCC